nr:MAG TPA: protein of unknown function (DUF3976) [Caudoviricetes sp.]
MKSLEKQGFYYLLNCFVTNLLLIYIKRSL